VLAETLFPISKRDFLTGRFEWSQRDELLENDPTLEHRLDLRTRPNAFRVNAYTVGYTREIGQFHALRSAVGANVTAYGLASELQASYGEHPVGVNMFLRFRLQRENN